MRRRGKLGRLDLMIIGARPDRIAAATEIPAVNVPALTDDEQRRLYELRNARRILSAAELLERYRLQGRSMGVR